ncbi:MAG TPA: IPT/TIG domain-containing protein [Candidatus Limnocylindrales bacterium]|nr:IPT/TIG domain-containing protein [Candidatus Limnocylindrales bacterium]
MATIANHVRPGQLIASIAMNSLLDRVSSLEDRVTALEGGGNSTGAAVIIGISPSGPVQVGQPLTVSGQNFGFSIGAQQVFIDNVQVNAFQAGSSDQKLIFVVPTSISNVPAQGRSATLSVSNGILPPAKQAIFLLPAFTLTGGVDVNYVGATTGAITPTQQATFQFTLKSQASLDATFAIQPLITGPANAVAFNANLQVLDENQAVNSAKTIQLFAGQQKTFFISINPVPLGSSGSFDLAVNASSGTLSGGSGSQTFTVGQAPPQPDTTITLNYSSAAFLPAGNGSATQSQIQLKSGAQAKITFQATFTVAGTYDITAAVTSGSNWTAGLFAQTTITPVVISAADLSNASHAANRLLDYLVVAASNASAAGKVEFRVKNEAVTTLCTHPVDLALIP